MVSVWDKGKMGAGGGGIWELLEERVQRSDDPSQNLGVWLQLAVVPGGLWREAREETLILKRDAVKAKQADIWQEAAEETLTLNRADVENIWEGIQDELALGESETDSTAVWEKVADETLILDRSRAVAWESAIGIREFHRYKPVRTLGWALKRLETARGEEYWVLKNLRTGAYLKLNEQQVYLWDMMDGAHSVQDLVIAQFLRYQTFSVEWLMGFLGQLRARGFLATGGVNVYLATGEHLWRQTIGYWARRVMGFLFRSELSIKGVDSFYGAVYKSFGRLLYNPVSLALIWLVSLAGLPAFFVVTRRGGLSLITGAGDSLGVGLAGLLASQIFAIFVHESAHALTTKHYGRTVRRGGVGLYFGMVAFFMDTTDIWMERRGPRLAVTWAGPLSGFLLGGVASLALLVSPATPWAGLAYQFATFCYGISILNLNPLLKLDGYYLLMDWLEMPRLREHSIAFVRSNLWKKLRAGEKFERDDLIYAVFGVLVLLWTVIIVLSMIRLYGSALFNVLQGLKLSNAAIAIIALLVVAVALLSLRSLRARQRPARA